MTIDCYKGFSKKPNSTKIPVNTDPHDTKSTVYLKEPTSVLNPVFILNGYDLTYNYIVWGSRYYYVDDIIINSDNEAEYHCSTDVLATYKTAIGLSSQYVVRSSHSYNLDVMDAKYPTTPIMSINRTDLTDISNYITPDSGTIVVGIKSKEGNSGVAFYCMNNTQFHYFMQYLYSDSWMTATDISTNLQKILSDPMDYIVSCNWYPFSITGTNTDVYFGFWDWTGQQMQRISESDRTRSFMHSGNLPQHPQVARGNYLNYAPYTQLELYCYTFGKVVLDPNKFTRDSNGDRPFIVNLLIDLFTGVGTLKVQGNDGKVYEASAQCAIPIQLSQVKLDPVKPLISLAGAAAALTTQNYIGAVGCVVNAVEHSVPQVSTIGAVGSITAYKFNIPKLHSSFYEIVDEDLAQLGRPLCEVKQISTIPGYIECDSPDLDITGTPMEKEKILNYMTSGFYYE